MVRRASADEFAQMIIDQLDEMIDQATTQPGPPLVMGLALHPYIVGQPFRLRHLKRAFKRIHERRSDLWITTAGSIAEAYRKLDDGHSAPVTATSFYTAHHKPPNLVSTKPP